MADEDDPRVAQLKMEFQARVRQIEVARAFYAGSQYVALNDQAQQMQPDRGMEIPEHDRQVAYSTQIQECVDYIAAQLSKGFQVTAGNAQVAKIVNGTLSNSPDLASDDDEDTINVVSPIRDALVAGDIGVRVRWDAFRSMPWLEFWEAEHVDFHFAEDNKFLLERVILTETVWVSDGPDVKAVEVLRERTWELDGDGYCQITVREDGDVVEVQPTGLPFIPWRLWRGQRKSMREARGESLVSVRVQDLARRYDAVEALSFRIARYNSHGNLAVIGDAAVLQINQDARVSKDVADVLTFPGGTALEVIELSTKPEMIQHQRDVILDALFSAFGLSRLDADTIEGMGQLSGYALEILNRKGEGTFDQIAKQLARDIRSTLNVAVDVYALFADRTPEQELLDDGREQPVEDLPDVDEVFADRKMTIVMGTGYIVDDTMQREDYTAGLVSRRWVLRERGMSDEEIDEIEKQIELEKPAAAPTVSLSPASVAAMASPIGAGTTLMDVAADETGG